MPIIYMQILTITVLARYSVLVSFEDGDSEATYELTHDFGRISSYKSILFLLF